MIKIFRAEEEVNKEKYFIVTYYLEAKTSLRDAAWNLAIGQSIGNPNNRSVWETEEMFENHSCFILANEEYLKSTKVGNVKIGTGVVSNVVTLTSRDFICKLIISI